MILKHSFNTITLPAQYKHKHCTDQYTHSTTVVRRIICLFWLVNIVAQFSSNSTTIFQFVWFQNIGKQYYGKYFLQCLQILDQLSKIANVVDTFEEKLVGIEKSFAELKVENEQWFTNFANPRWQNKQFKPQTHGYSPPDPTNSYSRHEYFADIEGAEIFLVDGDMPYQAYSLCQPRSTTYHSSLHYYLQEELCLSPQGPFGRLQFGVIRDSLSYSTSSIYQTVRLVTRPQKGGTSNI